MAWSTTITEPLDESTGLVRLAAPIWSGAKLPYRVILEAGDRARRDGDPDRLRSRRPGVQHRHDVVKVTPTGNTTYTTTVPAAGKHVHVLILTSGSSSFTLTFGSGFKPTGTLATGTTTGRVFVVGFVSDGTSLYETGRTAAMLA